MGTHLDESLCDYVWGERLPSLSLIRIRTACTTRSDVDPDNDYDFRDEKPLTQSDPADQATYNNMIAYRDMDGDGLADLSGGMLYFIADGVNYVPGMDWLFVPGDFGIASSWQR